MNAVLGILDDPFHAPVQHGLVESLLDEYQRARRKILEVGNLVQGEIASAVSYFIEGNVPLDRRISLNVEQLFDISGAVRALNAEYWQRAMRLTNVYDLMPQARRNEWNESIREKTCPEFVLENVRPTLETLLDSRSQFFAERVDGIYRGLSNEHLTNNPTGFGKRMIINYVFSDYGHVDSNRAGLINDLRCVVAKFMGRDEPAWNATDAVLNYAFKQRRGEWVTIDGGALRVRVYKVGTAHLEVHEDMAWRLNSILASLHPTAIPASFRTAPPTKKGKRKFDLINRLIPFKVIDQIRMMRREGRVMQWTYSNDKAMREQMIEVLTAIGGVPCTEGVQFDYNYDTVVDELMASGSIPDFKSHQFYPTPDKLAQRVVNLADIEIHHRVLEPSAGTGNLARKLPAEFVTCVEISPLHCEVLRALNLDAVEADFLQWADTTRERFDRIVMNPPFSEGRAITHLTEAARLLVPGGRLVAVLPSSCRGKNVLPGFDHEWSEVLDNEFANASVSVVLLAATAPATALPAA